MHPFTSPPTTPRPTRRALLTGALALTATVALATILPSAALAHHGWSAYDADKAIRVDVPLAEVRYRNPHGEVSIDHQGRRWNVVLAPISRMENRGLPKDALVADKTITIEGYPRRDGTPEIRAERITVDGKTIELR